MSMKVIQHYEVPAGGIFAIQFTSIPQNFSDLMVLLTIRSESAGTAGVILRPNNSTSNGANVYLAGNNTQAFSGTGSIVDGGAMNGESNTTASTYTSTRIYIPRYTSSLTKTFSNETMLPTNSAAIDTAYYIIRGSTWADSSPITSLYFYTASSVDFKQYCTATLYGITAGSDGITTVN